MKTRKEQKPKSFLCPLDNSVHKKTDGGNKMSKRKHHTLNSTPLTQRTFDKVSSLIADGSPEAKKAYRNTKASHHKRYEKKVSMSKIVGFWNPKGKRQARGSGV